MAGSDIKDRIKPASKPKAKPKAKKDTVYYGLFAVPSKLKPIVDDLVALLNKRLMLAPGQKIDFGGAYLGCATYKKIRRHVFMIDYIGVNTGDETQDKTYLRDDLESFHLCVLAEEYLATKASNTCGDFNVAESLLTFEASSFTKKGAAVIDEAIADLDNPASTLGRENLLRHVTQKTGIGDLTEDSVLEALRSYGGWELSALIREESAVEERYKQSDKNSDMREALRRQGTMMEIVIACKQFEPTTVVENMLAQIADEKPPVEGTADSPETRA